MADKNTGADKITGKTVLGALSDFLIICLMVGGAGFGGYYVGMNQRLAPVLLVPPGTTGARSEPSAAPAPNNKPAGDDAAHAGGGENTGKKDGAAAAASLHSTEAAAQKKPNAADKNAKMRYWLISSGEDYCGYSVTVNVNNNPVDSFFGPDKIVEVTKLVKPGENQVRFEAKALGEQYNKHTGDAAYAVTVKLVKGTHMQDNFAAKDVLMSYSRNASETQDFNDVTNFKVE
ncbi:MAG: hypothetical protein J0M35_09085 [Candidatus Obscuribacter phosphatis]|uniref:Uncharacterized protein n=1 Tax=Candidatus Obscuribacter phosphatis TaxID=1906157 RepID=A0A8J7PA71_9BACT|nr:hypothetical protein [Candidatus Obscuribacter phosphatis]